MEILHPGGHFLYGHQVFVEDEHFLLSQNQASCNRNSDWGENSLFMPYSSTLTFHYALNISFSPPCYMRGAKDKRALQKACAKGKKAQKAFRCSSSSSSIWSVGGRRYPCVLHLQKITNPSTDVRDRSSLS